MARGALKNLPRRRPADRPKDNTATIDQLHGNTLSDEMDPMNGWLTCECLFSFTLVVFLLLAALPFNLYASDLYQTREFFVLKAEEQAAAGAYTTAATLFEKAVRVDETAEGHVFLADTLVRAGRAGAAVVHYERATDLYGLVEDERNQTSVLMSLGKTYLEQLQRPDMAAYTYRHAIAMSTKGAGLAQTPTSGVLGAGLDSSTGSIVMQQATSDLAEAHFQAARALLMDASQANFVVATATADAHSRGYASVSSSEKSPWVGVHATAAGHLESATAVQPSHAAAHLLLANLWRDLGAPDKAIARYKKVIKYRAHDVESLLALGLAHLELGNVKQALVVFNKASNFEPNEQFPELVYWACALGDASSPQIIDLLSNLSSSNVSSGSRAAYAWQQRARASSALKVPVKGHVVEDVDYVTAASAAAGDGDGNATNGKDAIEVWPAQRAPPAYVKRLFDLEANKAFAHRIATADALEALSETAGVETTSRFFEVHGLGVHRSGWASLVLAELIENVMELSAYSLPVPTSRHNRRPATSESIEKAHVTLNDSAESAGWSAHVTSTPKYITTTNSNARNSPRNSNSGKNPSAQTLDTPAAPANTLPRAVFGWAGPFIVNRGGYALLDVLDLGCGRGRTGALLKGLANRLTGMDLSALALEENAKTLPGVYDELVLGDVELMFTNSTNHQVLDSSVDENNASKVDFSISSSTRHKNSSSGSSSSRSLEGAYDDSSDRQAGRAFVKAHLTGGAAFQLRASSMDLVVASDTVPYFGSVSALFRGSMRLLRPGGCFAFTLDLLPPCLPPLHGHTSNDTTYNSHSNRNKVHSKVPKHSSRDGAYAVPTSMPYELQPTGRWAHTWAYVETQALAVGFTIATTRCLNTAAHFALPKSEKDDISTPDASSLPDHSAISSSTNSNNSAASGWLREVPHCALAVVLHKPW